MKDDTNHEWTVAIEAIASAIRRSETALAKFLPGTSQHTLLTRRIQALGTAGSMISIEAGDSRPVRRSDDDLRNAAAPLTSLLHKSEQARTKLAAGTWQAAMLDRQIAAIRTVLPLLTKALDQRNGGSG
ncbi:MAG TPA: hypothetical protein DCR44_06145 [Acholeplasmatales bacterium]|nr:hypothetical protein [Acholeplasmatales bacterium]